MEVKNAAFSQDWGGVEIEWRWGLYCEGLCCSGAGKQSLYTYIQPLLIYTVYVDLSVYHHGVSAIYSNKSISHLAMIAILLRVLLKRFRSFKVISFTQTDISSISVMEKFCKLKLSGIVKEQYVKYYLFFNVLLLSIFYISSFSIFNIAI